MSTTAPTNPAVSSSEFSKPEGQAFTKPAYWTNEPAPKPAAPVAEDGENGEVSPTRYGDWVKNGIAIDF